MTFTDQEKAFLKQLVKGQLESFKQQADTVVHHEFVQFLAAEEKYEDFLEGILKKL